MKNKTTYLITIFTLIAILISGFVWSRGYDYDRGGRWGGDKHDRGNYLDKRGDGFFNWRSRGDEFFDWRSADANQDQDISHEEIENYASKIFSDFDKDKDGKLSEEEFSSHNLSRAGKFAELNYQQLREHHVENIIRRSKNVFQRMDEDNDNHLNEDEFYRNRMDERFKRLDKNENGMIEQGEMRRKWRK